jgi:hypothetical protein
MVATTQQHEVGEDRRPAVRPVADVVSLGDPNVAAGEAAGAIAMQQRAPERGRNRASADAHLHDPPLRVVLHDHPARVAGQPLRRPRGDVGAILEHGLAGSGWIHQGLGVDVDHHLVALARRTGVQLVVQRRLGQQGQGVATRVSARSLA